jgi:hypothetical protein
MLHETAKLVPRIWPEFLELLGESLRAEELKEAGLGSWVLRLGKC